MPIGSRLRSAWRTLAHTERLDRELDDELQSAVEILTARLSADGMDAGAARRAAEHAIGGPGGLQPVREMVRENRTGAVLDALRLDTRDAWRRLRCAPSLTLVVVATLSLGIAATTGLFSVVHAMLLAPLPYHDADRLAMVWLDQSASDPHGVDLSRWPLTALDLRRLREGAQTFEDFGAIWASGTIAVTDGTEPEQLRRAFVTPNFFDVLGVPPALGRSFTPADSRHDPCQILMIGWDLFERRFGADPQVIGRRIQTVTAGGGSGSPEGTSTVIGVLPRGFRLLLPREAATPDDLQAFCPFWPDVEADPRLLLRIVGRMKPGISIEQARGDVNTVARDFAGELGQPRVFTTSALHADDVREIRGPLLALFAAAWLLLVISCVNVAGLLIGRTAANARDTAVRLALGLGHGRLLRQSMIEGLMLAAGGAVVGVVLALLCLRLLLSFLPPSLDRLTATTIDSAALAFTTLISIAWGILLSLPSCGALASMRSGEALQRHTRSAGGQIGRTWRAGLTVAQIALSLTLLATAGLVARAFSEVLRVDPGFHADGQLTFRTLVPRQTFVRELRERLAALAGVTGVGAGSHLPYDGVSWSMPFSLDTPMRPGAPMADAWAVSPGLLETLGAQLLDGRLLEEKDDDASSPATVVDERLGRLLWPHGGAVGGRFQTPFGDTTVVGVIRHVRHRSLVDDLLPQIFVPWAIAQRTHVAFIVRTSGDPRQWIEPVRAAVASLEPRLVPYDVRPLTDYVEAARAGRQFAALLVAVFAAVSLLLTSVGTYTVLAYAVNQHRHELSVRRTLGASGLRIVRDVLGQDVKYALAGCLAGLAGAAVVARLLQQHLYGVHPLEPASYVAAAAIVLVGVLVASVLPAYRAFRVDAVTSLRSE